MQIGPPGRDGFIDFAHLPGAKQGLVGIPVLRAFAQQHQARGFAVDAVQRAQIGQGEVRFQAHQQGLAHITPAGRDGQKVRLVGHHQVRVFKQHGGFKRDGVLVSELAPVVHPGAPRIGGLGRQGAPVFAQHPARLHAFGPFGATDARQALGQVVDQQRPGTEPHPGQGQAAGRDAIAHGDVGATG